MPKDQNGAEFQPRYPADRVGTYESQRLARFEFTSDPLLARARMTDADAVQLDAIIEAGHQRLDHELGEQAATRDERIDARAMKLVDQASAAGQAYDHWNLVRRAMDDVARLDQREVESIKRETRALVEGHLHRSLGIARSRTRRRSR